MSLEDCQVEVGTTLTSRATLWPQTRLGPWAVSHQKSEATLIPGMFLSFLQDGQARTCNIKIQRSDVTFQKLCHADKGWTGLISIPQAFVMSALGCEARKIRTSTHACLLCR